MKWRLLPERSVDQNHFFVNGSLINQPNGIVWKHKCDQTPRKTSDVCFQLLPGTISCDQQPDVVSSINQTTCCCLWVHFLVSIVLAWCLQQLLWRRSVYSLSLLSHRSSTPKVTNKKDGSSERKEWDGGEESPQIPQRKILHTEVQSTRGRAGVFTCLPFGCN